MKTKKTIAAVAALIMAASSVSALPMAVYAEENAPAETAEQVPEMTPETEVTTPETMNDINPSTYTSIADLPVVLSPEELDNLDPGDIDANEIHYSFVAAEDGDMFVTYLANGSDAQGTVIPYGYYVKSGTEIYFCVNHDNFIGSDISLVHGGETTTAALTNNTVDAWIYSYTLQDSDEEIHASLVNNAAGILLPEEYDQLSPEKKAYYVQANIQSPAYIWVGDDETGFEVTSGNYVLKGTNMWIAMYREDYMDNDLLINGQIANATSSGGTDNFGILFKIYPNDTVLNVTTQPYAGSKSTLNIDTGAGIYAMYYVDGWTNGGEIYDGDEIRSGTPILIGAYKNLVAGYDIKVNDEVVPLTLNGDGTHMLYYYETTAGDIVVRRVPRDELTDYEKENFVPVNFGSNITVCEFPYSEGVYPDEPCIYYDSGDIIAKGSTLRLWVSADDYTGKILKINGQTVSMATNGDDDYIGNYIIPGNVSALNVTLEDAPVIPSRPSVPFSTNPTPTTTPAPSTSGGSASSADAPSEKSVVNNIKKSGKSSIIYNANEAGVTGDILKALSKNKNAKSITAKFNKFKVKIDKSDIENVKIIKDIDFTLSDKKIITDKQISQISALKDSKKIIQLNFESDAELDGLKGIKLQANAGKKFNGSKAVIYERKGKKLVKLGTTEVNNGYISFKTDHLGQFVIAVK